MWLCQFWPYSNQVPETLTGKRINASVDVKTVIGEQDQVELDLNDLSLDDFDGVDLDQIIEDAVEENNIPAAMIPLFKEDLRKKLTKNNWKLYTLIIKWFI